MPYTKGKSKKDDDKSNEQYIQPSNVQPFQQVPPPPISLEPTSQKKPEDQIKALREQIEALKPICEKFKTEALKEVKQIQGIAILPPPGPGESPNLLVLLSVEGTTEEKFKKKDELEKKLKELASRHLPSNIGLKVIILDEIWDMCFTGKYDILKLFVIGFPIYDAGWLGALRLAELHKSMVLKELENYVVCYVLAGSLVKGRATESSDVDTFVVIDDTDVTRMTAGELRARLRAMIWGLSEQAAIAAGVKNKLNTQVYILSEMWDAIRSANAVIFTFLRDGIPLYDKGLFQPWKRLLRQGKIIPTPEAVETYIKSGKQILNSTKNKLKEIASEDFFWACVTPSQGVLMLIGIPPPDPKETPQKLREHFVKTGLLEDKWPTVLEKILQIRKDIEHGKIKDVTAKQVEEAFNDAEEYLKRLDQLAKDLEIKEIRKKVSELYEKALSDIQTALSFVGVKSTEENALELFKTNLVEKKLAPAKFLEVLERIYELKKDPKNANLFEVDTLYFREEALAKDTFDLIRVEKGKKIEKFKISATYANKKKKADIWLLTDVAYVVKDTTDPKTPILKYVIDKNGELGNEQQSTLKELNAALEKFGGSPTPITKHTIESLKKILAEDLQIVIGA